MDSRHAVLTALLICLTFAAPLIADEPQPREAYRFDGKSFAEWQAYALTEIKVQRRLEALEAMQAFGIRGYGPEAAATIMKIVAEHFREFGRLHTYESQRFYDDVIGKARNAQKTIGSASVAGLLQGLTSSDGNVRRFCGGQLNEFDLRPTDTLAIVKVVIAETPTVSGPALYFLRYDRERLLRAIKSDAVLAQDLVDALERAMADKETRHDSIILLGELGSLASSAVPALLAAVEEKRDTGEMQNLVCALGNIGADADMVVPVLIKIIDNEEKKLCFNQSSGYAAEALGKYGPAAKAAIPVLLRHVDGELRSCGSGSAWHMYEPAMAALEKIEAPAADVVPHLIVLLKRGPGHYGFDEALAYLGKLGPQAKEAGPVLAELFTDYPSVRPKVARILRGIGPEGEEALAILQKRLEAEK